MLIIEILFLIAVVTFGLIFFYYLNKAYLYRKGGDAEKSKLMIFLSSILDLIKWPAGKTVLNIIAWRKRKKYDEQLRQELINQAEKDKQ
jgi:hypothetical protein